MKDTHLVSFEVNGQQHELLLEARRTLADVLRQDIGLTGTHLGCEHGICGACTVLVDGDPVRSCLMFGVQADGRSVQTVESLADGDEMSDLQQAFSRNHALQCGFCTPGFLMLAEGYLAGDPDPDREQIREVASANLCRCTGYSGIVDAITEVAAARRAARSGPEASAPASSNSDASAPAAAQRTDSVPDASAPAAPSPGQAPRS